MNMVTIPNQTTGPWMEERAQSRTRAEGCDYKELCSVLQDILSNLHYSTHECCDCGWIAHEDDDWGACAKCSGRLCEACVSRIGDGHPVLCDTCVDEHPNCDFIWID